MSQYQPKTGAKCHCKPGLQRDNCPDCEGTGLQIDFKAIRERSGPTAIEADVILGKLHYSGKTFRALIMSAATETDGRARLTPTMKPEGTIIMPETIQAIPFQGSLRDWFAGMALQGLVASFEASSVIDVADTAYQYADAMIVAKEAHGKS